MTTLELLRANDDDIAALIRKPKTARAYLKKNWHDAQPDQAHSASIRGIVGEVDYVLRAGRAPGELPLGFLQGDGHVIGKVKRMARLRVGDEIVQYPEYENEDDFYYGPPHAFLSKQVAEIAHALSVVDDDWLRRAFNPDDLIAPYLREAADFNLEHYVSERVELCQEAVRELKPFLTLTASAGLGLIRHTW